MTKTSTAIDTARVELLLSELRLPAIEQMWLKRLDRTRRQSPSVRPPWYW